MNELRAVQIQSDLQKTTNGTTLTFKQYRTLLINAATGCDKRSATTHSKGKFRRSVFSSEVSFDNQNDLSDVIYDDEPPNFLCDVDTMPSELLCTCLPNDSKGTPSIQGWLLHANCTVESYL